MKESVKIQTIILYFVAKHMADTVNNTGCTINKSRTPTMSLQLPLIVMAHWFITGFIIYLREEKSCPSINNWTVL